MTAVKCLDGGTFGDFNGLSSTPAIASEAATRAPTTRPAMTNIRSFRTIRLSSRSPAVARDFVRARPCGEVYELVPAISCPPRLRSLRTRQGDRAARTDPPGGGGRVDRLGGRVGKRWLQRGCTRGRLGPE